MFCAPSHCLCKGGTGKAAGHVQFKRWITHMQQLKYSPPLRYSLSSWNDKNMLNNWCGFIAELKWFYTVHLQPHKVFLKFLQCLYEYLTFSNGALFYNFPTWLSACCFILATILLVVFICIKLLHERNKDVFQLKQPGAGIIFLFLLPCFLKKKLKILNYLETEAKKKIPGKK